VGHVQKSNQSTSIDMTQYVLRIMNSIDTSNDNKSIYKFLVQNFSELLILSGQEPKKSHDQRLKQLKALILPVLAEFETKKDYEDYFLI
jgi:hypothetical protein